LLLDQDDPEQRAAGYEQALMVADQVKLDCAQALLFGLSKELLLATVRKP